MTVEETKADACGLYAVMSIIYLVAMSKIMEYKRDKSSWNLINTTLGIHLHKRYKKAYLLQKYFLEYKLIFWKVVKTVFEVFKNSMYDYVSGGVD